jgi:hypothetical protein
VRAKQIDAILPRYAMPMTPCSWAISTSGRPRLRRRKIDAAYVDLWKSLRPEDSG